MAFELVVVAVNVFAFPIVLPLPIVPGVLAFPILTAAGAVPTPQQGNCLAPYGQSCSRDRHHLDHRSAQLDCRHRRHNLHLRHHGRHGFGLRHRLRSANSGRSSAVTSAMASATTTVTSASPITVASASATGVASASATATATAPVASASAVDERHCFAVAESSFEVGGTCCLSRTPD